MCNLMSQLDAAEPKNPKNNVLKAEGMLNNVAEVTPSSINRWSGKDKV